jgi:hypothetical protein
MTGATQEFQSINATPHAGLGPAHAWYLPVELLPRRRVALGELSVQAPVRLHVAGRACQLLLQLLVLAAPVKPRPAHTADQSNPAPPDAPFRLGPTPFRPAEKRTL